MKTIVKQYKAKEGLYNVGQKRLYRALHPMSPHEKIVEAVIFLERCGGAKVLQRKLRRRFLRAQRAFPF